MPRWSIRSGNGTLSPEKPRRRLNRVCRSDPTGSWKNPSRNHPYPLQSS